MFTKFQIISSESRVIIVHKLGIDEQGKQVKKLHSCAVV